MIDNVNGQFEDCIRSNKIVEEISLRFTEVANAVRQKRAPLSFLLEIGVKEQNTERLLEIIGLEKTEIRDIAEVIECSFETQKKQCQISIQVVKRLLTNVNDTELVGIELVNNRLKDIDKLLSSGKVLMEECLHPKLLWGDLFELKDLCIAVQHVVHSGVFWNVAISTVIESKRQKEDELTVLPLELPLCQDSEEVRSIDKVRFTAVEFLKCLKDVGINTYFQEWTNLVIEKNIPLEKVISMFLNMTNTIEDEMNTFETVSGKNIESSTRRTLIQLFEMDELTDRVEKLQNVFIIYEFDTEENHAAKEALREYEKICNLDSKNEIFENIEKYILKLLSMLDCVNDVACRSLGLVAESSELRHFLKEIEDDEVRNLIDAVEDISESFVQEVTVTALIETKRFAQSVVFIKESNKLFEEFLRCVNKHVKAQETNYSKLPEKINDCISNLHNLYSLYKNVTNRGQQTKEIIQSVIKRGNIVFLLDEMKSSVVFKVVYREQGQLIEKYESTLGDIRSRALLLLHSDRQGHSNNLSKDGFGEFVKLFDTCQEYRDILETLHTAGHMKYITINEKIIINNADSIRAFKTTCRKLNAVLEAWTTYLKNAREKWYLMNYIQGYQIHLLYTFLTSPSSESSHDAESILKFIHPEMSADELSKVFHLTHNIIEHDTFLDQLGDAIHKIYASLSLAPIQRNIETEDRVQKFDETVHEGKLLLAVLDEKSDLLLRTILALYQGTHDMLPEPYQLLFCTSETTWNEIELHLARCKGAYQFYNMSPLFCLANIELLTNDLQFELIDKLRSFQTIKEFRLALVCRGSSNNPFVDLLTPYVASVKPITELTENTILQSFFPDVKIVTSEVAGLGKSAMISRIARQSQKSTTVLHVSGVFDRENLIRELKWLCLKPEHHVLHIDIANVDRPLDLNIFIFQLIVIGFVSDGMHSFLLPTKHICIEIANTVNNKLCRALACTAGFKREHLTWNHFDDFIISREINSSVQIVCNYLQLLKLNTLNEKELHFSGLLLAPPLQDSTCRSLLSEYLSIQTDISFSTVNIFLNVLADQLKKFSCSAYFKVSHISHMVGKNKCPVIRSSIVSAMVEVARDFASRSVSACRATQAQTLQDSGRDTVAPFEVPQQIVSRTNSMIRWEESNHLIYVFHNQDIQTLSVMYRERSKVPSNMQDLFKIQIHRDMVDYNSLQQRDLHTILQRVARVQKHLLDEIQIKQMTSEYTLTPDNLLKMVLIMLRISAKVPVVVMGETGCGKTSLIRYLATVCEIPFNVFSIHSGITQKDIVQTVIDENEQCLENTNSQRWLFLDEINTSESIGLICDVICHHKCKGLLLAPNLIIMGACNPYKLRSKDSIITAGLSGKVKTDDLSKLVYRVLPLPEMVLDYVWDFGSLTDADELKYIEQMTGTVFEENKKMHILFRDLISESHRFVRYQHNTVYSVSLRDVERCKLLVKWFTKNWTSSKETHEKDTMDYKSMLLALSVCYQSRFDDKDVRRKYMQTLAVVFTEHKIKKSEEDLHSVIRHEYNDLLKYMGLPRGTARNAALQENVFLITVCILTKIPIFVVGKPGCSKSLAMQVIRSNLRGKDSKHNFFKRFPQLYCVSFQGSESSTSDGILKVFSKAEEYQKNNTNDAVLSVVILDEVGLAEVSKFNPLKVLHSLLEPDGRCIPNVAVVGISNWALDASKMNRGITLSRPDMDDEELFETAVSISKSFIESKKTKGLGCSTISIDKLIPDLKDTATSYRNYTKHLQFKNFHGLRDYYALVKCIAKEYVKSPKKPHVELIRLGLERNFGGLSIEKQSLMDHFCQLLGQTYPQTISVKEIIKDNIQDKEARHLMIITEGESVRETLEHTFDECDRKQREVIFGSQFQEDLTDDYHYRMLSRIILCMEQGMLLILKDLDGIYGSLYDMLNQNYTTIGKKNNCRVALGPYSNPFCHVADTFRCIVIVESKRLYTIDPPFLNRFEKQALSIRDFMSCEDRQCMNQLNDLVHGMSLIQGTQFSKEDVFPYFNDELLASLAILSSKSNLVDKVAFCERKLLWLIKPDSLIRLHRVNDKKIRDKCRKLKETYFRLPIHSGLRSFIDYQKKTFKIKQFDDNLHLQ